MKIKKHYVHLSFEVTEWQYAFLLSRADYYGLSLVEYFLFLAGLINYKPDDTD